MTLKNEIRGGKILDILGQRLEPVRDLKTRLETEKLYHDSSVLPWMRCLRNKLEGKLYWVAVSRESEQGADYYRVKLDRLARVRAKIPPPDHSENAEPPAILLEWEGDGEDKGFLVQAFREVKFLRLTLLKGGEDADEIYLEMPESLGDLRWRNALSMMFVQIREGKDFSEVKKTRFAIKKE